MKSSDCLGSTWNKKGDLFICNINNFIEIAEKIIDNYEILIRN